MLMKLARLNEQAEIFLSIQGEGRSLGQPSIFVRSSLCNLYCVWCDTDYTWNWQGTPYAHRRDGEPGYAKYDPQAEIIERSPEEIVAAIRRLNCRRLVATGGEPLLQQREWVTVMRLLREQDDGCGAYWFEVETNGTLAPSVDLDMLVDQYNVSPKLSNSGVPERLRWKPEALTSLAENPKAWFKFVVSAPTDLDEILTLCRSFRIGTERVYLMPEGTDEATLSERQAWLADLCARQGFQLTDRLHVRIWGARRGI